MTTLNNIEKELFTKENIENIEKLETIESRELYLYTINYRQAYSVYENVSNNLLKKINKGSFELEKAVKAFYPVVNQGRNGYLKDYGFYFKADAKRLTAMHLLYSFLLDNDIL